MTTIQTSDTVDFTAKDYRGVTYHYQRTTEYSMLRNGADITISLFSTFSDSYRTEHYHYDLIKKGGRTKRPGKAALKNCEEILNAFAPGLSRWMKEDAQTIITEADCLFKAYRVDPPV